MGYYSPNFAIYNSRKIDKKVQKFLKMIFFFFTMCKWHNRIFRAHTNKHRHTYTHPHKNSHTHAEINSEGKL